MECGNDDQPLESLESGRQKAVVYTMCGQIHIQYVYNIYIYNIIYYNIYIYIYYTFYYIIKRTPGNREKIKDGPGKPETC